MVVNKKKQDYHYITSINLALPLTIRLKYVSNRLNFKWLYYGFYYRFY